MCAQTPVFQNTGADRVNNEFRVIGDGLNQIGRTVEAGWVKVKRVSKMALDAANDTVYWHQSAQCFHEYIAANNAEVRALNKAVTEITREVGVIKIITMLKPMGEHSNVWFIGTEIDRQHVAKVLEK